MNESEILKSITWAVERLREQGIARDNYLFKEHHFAFYNFGYMMELCDEQVQEGTLHGVEVVVPTSKLALKALLSGEAPPEGTKLPYACISYDSRCDCCGAMTLMGSEDIYKGSEIVAANKIAAHFAEFAPDCDCHERFGL